MDILTNCWMRAAAHLAVALVATLALGACDDVQPGDANGGGGGDDAGTGSTTECVAGAVDFCVCPSLEVGVTHCDESGAWGACDCSIPVGPDGGTTVDAGVLDAGGSDAGTTDAGGTDSGTPDVVVEPDPSCGPEGRRYLDEDWEELMRPGGDCIGCHLEERARGEDDAPIYTLAGTVFPYFGFEEGCAGTGGMTIEITDANGQVIRLVSNSVGNFFTRQNIAMPYTAKVIDGDREMVMIEPVSNGDCNSCHTPTGLEGAPGRVVTP